MTTLPRSWLGAASLKVICRCVISAVLVLSFKAGDRAVFAAADPAWHGPSGFAIDPRSSRLFVAGERSGMISELLLPHLQRGRTIDLHGSISGVIPCESIQSLLLTLTAPTPRLVCVDLGGYRERFSAPAGAGACSPVVAPRSHRIYTCNRFDNAVGIHDLTTGAELGTIRVLREPVAACLSPDESLLMVANHLPETAANLDQVSAAISLVHLDNTNLTGHVRLPSGSTSLRGLSANPDGTLCAVVHNIARFQVAAVQVEHGWMNVSALSLIDLKAGRLLSTVLLDATRSGAANPWAVSWTPDGSKLLITHAGTHELSIVDAVALLERLASHPQGQLVPNLEFMSGIRKRVLLPVNGPRSLQVMGNLAFVGGFFSDTVSAVDIVQRKVIETITLSDTNRMSQERLGEQLFNDARICHQSWQSCASCHPDGRADGLNWDLLNDGIGNPKNTKSMLMALQTPPAMSSGVRGSAEKAVRSGLRHILFAKRPEHEAQAIDSYIKSLRPIPSPELVNGALSSSALKGKELFEDPKVGCAACHPSPLFTDLQSYPVTAATSARKLKEESFDTPTLIECWRTAPYLHDGAAATIEDVLTRHNQSDRHGKTSHLSSEQIRYLAAYVRSL